MLDAALRNLEGEAVAIGVIVGDELLVVCRGALAGESVGERTGFYGASVTKQIVGIAAARAVVGGSLAVEDSITRWIPELPGALSRVRLTHLIHHTSGLPDVTDPTAGVPRSNDEIIERLRDVELAALLPGARYAYSNAGYVLLAEAVARSVGRSTNDLAEDLFSRTGLVDTRLGGSAVHLEGWPDPPGTIGDGGLWTSVNDLTRWLQACNANAFGEDVHRLAETTGLLADGSPVDYAWGVRVTPSPAGRMITHGGSWDPWLAKTVRIPDQTVAVAVLSVGAAELAVSRTGTDLALALAQDISSSAGPPRTSR